MLERAEHKCGVSTRADADCDVALPEVGIPRRLRAEVAIVLLRGFDHGMGLDQVGRDAERGRALGGVEPCDQPARTGAEIVQTPAGSEALGDFPDGVCHLVEAWCDRADGFDILGVHEPHEVARAQVVELVSERVEVLAHGRSSSAAASAQTRAEPCVAT